MNHTHLTLNLLLTFDDFNTLLPFQEGRKIWENILSISRNLSRMVHLYHDDVGRERKLRIQNLLAAFPYMLRQHIRPRCLSCDGNSIDAKFRLRLTEASIEAIETRHEGDKIYGGTTNPEVLGNSLPIICWVDRRNLPWSLLSKGALRNCAKAKNRPLWVCDRLGHEVVSIPYGPTFTSRERLTMISQIEKLTNTIGACERIHQTAVPLNYARHALRSLTIWLFTLPFALVGDLGLLTGPVIGFTAWLLFGVYQIGHSIEDPFQGTIRLSVLCDAIHKDILANFDTRSSDFSLEENSPVEKCNEVECQITSYLGSCEEVLHLANQASRNRDILYISQPVERDDMQVAVGIQP